MKELVPDVVAAVQEDAGFKRLLNSSAGTERARSERLGLFLKIVPDLRLGRDAEETKRIVDTCLNVVEDQFSGVRYVPDNWMTDGRMYPAGEDLRRKSPMENVRIYFHRRHTSHFGENGAIRIVERPTLKHLVDCPGRDGLYIGDLLEEPSSSAPGFGT
jgi:hypothetical protein